MHASSPAPTRTHAPIELLIFDLDGTLVDTALDLAHAVNFALQALGKTPLALEEVLRMVGDGARTLLTRALGQPTEEELLFALQKFRAHYAAHLADHSKPYPGIINVLAHFDQTKKAVLTNKPHEFTLSLLEQLHLSHAFVAIQGAQPQLPLKPDPTSLQHLLALMRVPASRALMIGDSENDILAGQAAGTMTCAATYGFRPAKKLLALAPDFVIHAPRDLLTLGYA